MVCCAKDSVWGWSSPGEGWPAVASSTAPPVLPGVAAVRLVMVVAVGKRADKELVGLKRMILTAAQVRLLTTKPEEARLATELFSTQDGSQETPCWRCR